MINFIAVHKIFIFVAWYDLLFSFSDLVKSVGLNNSAPPSVFGFAFIVFRWLSKSPRQKKNCDLLKFSSKFENVITFNE